MTDIDNLPHEARIRPTSPPAEERSRKIQAQLDAEHIASEFVPSEGGYLELPVVNVSSDTLVYRIDNGRILSELVGRTDTIGLTWEEAQAQAETAQVQSLLHELLVEKAKDPDGPIFEEFERHAKQTAPLLIRHDGVVVNGNRRLSAMRELKAVDPERYASFGHIAAAVLPEDVDREQQEYIEAALQMAPDLKLDYGWINRRLKIRQHVLDLGIDRIISAYRFKDRAAVEQELHELELAEAFLEWNGTPRQYAELADEEDHFIALGEELTALPDAYIRRVWRSIGFAMVSARTRLESRIDHYYPFTKPDPNGLIQWVPRTMAEDRGLAQPQARGENKSMNPRLVDRLMPVIDVPAQAENTARNAMALIDTLKGDQKRILGANRALQSLRTARKALETLSADDITGDQLRNIRADVVALQELVHTLPGGGNLQKSTRDPLLPRISYKLQRIFGNAK